MPQKPIKQVVTLIASFAFSLPTMAGQICNSGQATTPSSNFEINGNGTVTDVQTGLMWKQCLEGQSGGDCQEGSPLKLNWQEAIHLVETTNSSGGFLGYTDWRLPNIKELRSIVEEKCIYPTLNLELFPGQSHWVAVWSSSPRLNSGYHSWLVEFEYGEVNSVYRNKRFTSSLNVQLDITARLVRDE